MALAVGAIAPPFSLPDSDGVATSPAGITVVVFTCNHCPYALAWHSRIQAVARDYGERGMRVLQINSNDAARYPRDSPEAMAARVAAGDFAGPYLRDESQEVAHAWCATVTPDVYVLDGAGRLVYHGAPDADHGDEAQNAQWVRDALEDLLAGRAVTQPQPAPIGCTIKWR